MTLNSDDLRIGMWVVFNHCSTPFVAAILGSPFRIEAINRPWIIGRYMANPLAIYTYDTRCFDISRVNNHYLKVHRNLTIEGIKKTPSLIDTPFPFWIQKYLKEPTHEETNLAGQHNIESSEENCLPRRKSRRTSKST